MCNFCGYDISTEMKKKSSARKIKCPGEEKEEEDISQRPEGRKRRRLPKSTRYSTKLEKIMQRIQPPIADRDKYLNPRHVNCFLNSEIAVRREVKCRPCPRLGMKFKRKRCPNADEDRIENVIGERESGTRRNDDEEISRLDDGAMIDGGKGKGQGNVQRSGSKRKRNMRKDRTPREKWKAAHPGDSDSETSINSVDSEVCLAGLSLIEGDKDKIQTYLHNDDRHAIFGKEPEPNTEEEQNEMDISQNRL